MIPLIQVAGPSCRRIHWRTYQHFRHPPPRIGNLRKCLHLTCIVRHSALGRDLTLLRRALANRSGNAHFSLRSAHQCTHSRQKNGQRVSSYSSEILASWCFPAILSFYGCPVAPVVRVKPRDLLNLLGCIKTKVPTLRRCHNTTPISSAPLLSPSSIISRLHGRNELHPSTSRPGILSISKVPDHRKVCAD